MITLAEKIVEEAAASKDANLKVTRFLLARDFANDITKAEDAAVAAVEMVKENIPINTLADLITNYTHGNVDGHATLAYIRGFYIELFDSKLEELILNDEADNVYLVTIFKEVDSYLYGVFDDNADFAETYFFDMNGEPDSLIASSIDWNNVWESTLRHDYFESDGYYFRNW